MLNVMVNLPDLAATFHLFDFINDYLSENCKSSELFSVRKLLRLSVSFGASIMSTISEQELFQTARQKILRAQT